MDKQQLWDDFLARWPREELHKLTLAQYVSIKDKDTTKNDSFIYWLETVTTDLGSIQGNTAIKFGIYKRVGVAKEQKNVTDGEIYSWKSSYGNNEEQAFFHVRSLVKEVAELAFKGDLEAIESIDFFPLIKWKIAFMYQNQQNPSLVNIFSRSLLEVLNGGSDKFDYPSIYKKLIEQKDIQPLLEYCNACWEKAGEIDQQQKNEKIIKRFLHKQTFKDNYKSWPSHTINAFCDFIRMAHDNGLDVFTITTGKMIRIGRKEQDGAKAESVFATFEPCYSKINFEQRYLYRGEYLNSEISLKLIEQVKKSKHLNQFNTEFPVERNPHWPQDYLAISTIGPQTMPSINESNKDYILKCSTPLNQILYGPPGTGKTYHTIDAAVNAAVPNFVAGNRVELQHKYDELVATNRIRFVTFHQSYGYENFVEGISAKTADDNVEYYDKKGVFKSISEAARNSSYEKAYKVNPDANVWKISIFSMGPNKVKDYCFANEIAAIGWGNTGDLSDGVFNEYFEKLGRNNKNSIRNFTQEIVNGDVVLCIDSNKSVQAIGVVSGEYQYVKDGIEGHDYPHQLPVKWLSCDFSVTFYELNGNKQFNLPTCHQLGRMQPAMVFEHLAKNNVVINTQEKSVEPENYVLIIDEINRGNISKIFGELITLIEPSKRAGKNQEESLEVTLPVSGDKFSVPDNLYLIGTMNTADRSLAMMDTAMRRRFDFIEMMPNYSVLYGALLEYQGVKIDIAKLLKVMNKRIEVLYDREHTLGHAFFISVKKLIDKDKHQQAFIELASVFKNKIIPLLEEYFYEDWNKIRLVLGDNRKDTNAIPPLIFVAKEEISFDDVFGNEHGLDLYDQEKLIYRLASFQVAGEKISVWHNPKAYVAIYGIDKGVGKVVLLDAEKDV